MVNQTFADIEIICVNDGSTDDCLSILNEYTAKDERIIVVSQENQGPGVARNKGLEIAKGEYISFIDPDDWVNDTFYQNLYELTRAYKYDIVKGRRVDIYSNDNCIKENLDTATRKFPDFQILADSWWSCLYKTEIIKNNHITFPSTRWKEDMAFLGVFYVLAKTFKCTESSEYYYIHRNDSLAMKSKDYTGSLDGVKSKLYLFNFIQSIKLSKEEYINAMKLCLSSMVYSLDEFIINCHCEKFESISPHINEVLSSLKYKDDLLADENFKFLSKGNFSKESFDKRYIRTKFNNLGFLKKIFYLGNARDYKMISILGILFTFKRF